MIYTYTAYTPHSDGVTRTHSGTLTGAIRKAIAYAKSTYPSTQYVGYGPTIVVADGTGRRVVERKL